MTTELISSAVETTETALVLPANMSYESWEECGKQLQRVGRCWQWWIGDWLNYGEAAYGEKYSQAIEETELEYKALANAAWVSNAVEPSTRVETLSWSHHRTIAALPPKEQKRLLKKAEKESLTVAELRAEIKTIRSIETKKNTPPMPDGKFDLILADPPWQYDFAETDNRKIENHYPTMTLEMLEELEPPAADNCVLLLWATAPKLYEAFKVIEAWGFTYKTNAIWDKTIIGMGYWFRGQHEILMVATKGDASPPEQSNRVSSVFSEKRSKHSRKPECVYDWIERAFADTTKCEMFCRTPRENWTSWGNEIEP